MVEEKTHSSLQEGAKAYELGFLLVPTLSEEEVTSTTLALKERFQKAEAVFIAEEFPKKIGLAYPMKKKTADKKTTHTGGYFGWLAYEALPERLVAVEEELRGDSRLLRFLLLITAREKVIVPRRAAFFKKSEEQEKEVLRTDTVKKQKISRVAAAEKPVLTEEELDRTIAELVIE